MVISNVGGLELNNSFAYSGRGSEGFTPRLRELCANFAYRAIRSSSKHEMLFVNFAYSPDPKRQSHELLSRNLTRRAMIKEQSTQSPT
jgi:hypothetical protein